MLFFLEKTNNPENLTNRNQHDIEDCEFSASCCTRISLIRGNILLKFAFPRDSVRRGKETLTGILHAMFLAVL